MNPSRFGIITFGSVAASIVSVGLMIFASASLWATTRARQNIFLEA
jgi:hypothetical protein